MWTFVVNKYSYDVYNEEELMGQLVEQFYSDGLFLDDEIDLAIELAHNTIQEDYIKIYTVKGTNYYLSADVYDSKFNEVRELLIEKISV